MEYNQMLNEMESRAIDAHRRSELLLQMIKDTNNRRYDGSLLSAESRREWTEYEDNLKFAIPKGPTN